MSYRIALAKISDKSRISELIKHSVRALSSNDYSKAQIDAALTSAWGVDTQLLRDNTYFCVWLDDELSACGGWSYRKTLFGSDNRKDRDTSRLDPLVDAAKIRAFFVHPAHSRRGLGSMLLKHCEQSAWDSGFRNMEMGATLPGMRLYQQHSYEAGEQYEFNVSDEESIMIIPMFKKLESRPE